jgi:hypothetical protein
MLPSITYLQTPEGTILALAIVGLITGAVYGFFHWVFACPRTPDPWGADVEQEVEREEAVAVCPHCLTRQEHNGWFCPECGSMSGQYGNFLPAVYIFSIGDGVRTGVQQRSRWSPLLVTGYVLIAFAFLSILAPVYCLFLFLNRARISRHQRLAPADASGA